MILTEDDQKELFGYFDLPPVVKMLGDFETQAAFDLKKESGRATKAFRDTLTEEQLKAYGAVMRHMGAYLGKMEYLAYCVGVIQAAKYLEDK